MCSIEYTQVFFCGGPQNKTCLLLILSAQSLALLSSLLTPSGMPAAPAPLSSPLPLQDSRTALHNAALNGHLESVRLLLDRGADKEAKDNVRREGRGVDVLCVAV